MQARITTDTPRFHPFASFTEVHFIEDPVLDPNVEVRPSIRSILLSEFNALGITRFGFLPSAEMEWFASNNRRVIGTVVLDLTDEDWLYVLFSRHSGARPEVEDVQIDIKTRREARERLLDAMEQMICDRSRE